METEAKLDCAHLCSYFGFNHLANCLFQSVKFYELHRTVEQKAKLRMASSTVLNTTLNCDYNIAGVFKKLLKLFIKLESCLRENGLLTKFNDFFTLKRDIIAQVCLVELTTRLNITSYAQIKKLSVDNLLIPNSFNFSEYLGFITLLFENNVSIHNVYYQASNYNANKHEMLNNSEIELYTWRLLEPQNDSIQPITRKLSPILVMNLLTSHDLETFRTKIFGFVHRHELLCLQVPSLAADRNTDDVTETDSVDSDCSRTISKSNRKHIRKSSHVVVTPESVWNPEIVKDKKWSRPEILRLTNGRRKRVIWNAVEIRTLVKGVRKHGYGKWVEILKDRSFSKFLFRMDNEQLRAKYRNLCKIGDPMGFENVDNGDLVLHNPYMDDLLN